MSKSTAAENEPFSSGHRKGLQGPCYLKLLVNNIVAGSIIGRNGTVIGQIESNTGTTMKLSPSNQMFPGTTDRIVVMSGEQDKLNDALNVILDKIDEASVLNREVSPNSNRETACKVVVPKSAVSGIIGKAGQQIKHLQDETGAKVKISNREQGLIERVVSIKGSLTQVRAAAAHIATLIQEDPNLKDHMYVVYEAQPVQQPNNLVAGSTQGYGGGNALAGFAAFNPFVVAAQNPYQYPALTTPYLANQAQSGELENVMMENCEICLEIPDSSIGYVIGKQGVHLNEIMRGTGATIKLSQKGDFIPGTQNRKVTLSGPLSAVHRAHTRLLLRVKDGAAAATTSPASNSSFVSNQQSYGSGRVSPNMGIGGAAAEYGQFSGVAQHAHLAAVYQQPFSPY